MKVQAIVPMGGLGVRFQQETPKPLVFLQNKPIFIHTVEAISSVAPIHSIILVGHKDFIAKYQDAVTEYKIAKVKTVVPGGETRSESVQRGMEELDPDTDMVLIHDGVRPLVTAAMVRKAVDHCQAHKAVVLAVPVKPTIKKVDARTMEVVRSLDRNELWEIQTPQVFDRKILQQAYAQSYDRLSTDDASLVERLGYPVKVLQGSYHNIKITTPEDLVIAQTLLTQIKGET
jgi:2-C-methyl-D-erythritol 4-phosphate cytidylyltransferase